MPSAAVHRAYLTTHPYKRPLTLDPTQVERLVARSMTQGYLISLTREDTNPNAADAGGQWWRAGLVSSFDRGFVAPRHVHPDRVEWDWATPDAELAARRFVRDDPNLPLTWFTKDHHDPQPPSLSELVQMLAWDMRYQGTRILDIDATNPITISVHEKRLYGVTQDWERPTAVFDWAALNTFARRLTSCEKPGDKIAGSSPAIEDWYGPARLPGRVRGSILTALRPHAEELFGEARLRINLTNWTVTGYEQDPADWGDRLCAEAKDALGYLQAPRFTSEAQFLRWATRGGLEVTVPCALITGGTVTTTLRVVPATGLVTVQPVHDTSKQEALDAAHMICALTEKDCACTQARTLLEATDESDLSPSTNTQSTEPDWASRSRAIARVANGYASLRRVSPASAASATF